jgi:cysteine-rich repeat protein
VNRTRVCMGLVLALAGLGCSKARTDSIVYVTVTAAADMPAAVQLRATLSGDGISEVELFPDGRPTTAIAFAPAATFVLVVPTSHHGDLAVAIDALDGASQIVGHGEGSVTLNVGGRADMAIVLDLASVGDAGAGDAGGGPDADGRDAQALDGVVRDVAMGDTQGSGGGSGAGGATSTGAGGGPGGAGGSPSTGGVIGGAGGTSAGGGVSGSGGSGGVSGTGGTVVKYVCGNGKVEPGELCDCGSDAKTLPSGCKAMNGMFYGDGKGCSKTCTKEPSCIGSSGQTQACTTACGDGNIDPGEDCDDANRTDGDGCSSGCKAESGFTCTTETVQDSYACASGSGQCLDLPVTYRDFQPQNVSGGHSDFYFLSAPDLYCVPNSAGPSKGADATARCWGLVASTLLNGKPQPGPTTTCACQFSDWNVGSAAHIPGGYTQADSPLYTSGGYRSDVTSYTSDGGPIWKGTVAAYKNGSTFKQWYNDDSAVNKTFTGVIEMPSIGSNIYQFASASHLADGGFFPLDNLNPSQASLCNLWPYWSSKFFPSCVGDQYFFPPRVGPSDCPNQATLSSGCWVSNVKGVKHDFYFTTEMRYDFVYDGGQGLTLAFYATDDLFVFINGTLVLDLGGVHQQLPGKLTIAGDPGNAQVTEGGCLDAAGNITGVTAGSNACSFASPPTSAGTPDDFRVRTVPLGLGTGKVYELAIFGANRNPTGSELQITLPGFGRKRSLCTPN